MIDVVLAAPGSPTHAPSLRQLLSVCTGLTKASLWNMGRTKTMLAKESRRRRGVGQQLLVDLLVGSKCEVASISSSWVGWIVQGGPEEGR